MKIWGCLSFRSGRAFPCTPRLHPPLRFGKEQAEALMSWKRCTVISARNTSNSAPSEVLAVEHLTYKCMKDIGDGDGRFTIGDVVRDVCGKWQAWVCEVFRPSIVLMMAIFHGCFIKRSDILSRAERIPHQCCPTSTVRPCEFNVAVANHKHNPETCPCHCKIPVVLHQSW